MPRVSEATNRLWLGRVLSNAGTAAVVGITLSLQRLFSALMDAGFNPARVPRAIRGNLYRQPVRVGADRVHRMTLEAAR